MSRKAPLLLFLLAATGGCSGPRDRVPGEPLPGASATGVSLELTDRGNRIEIRADRLAYGGPSNAMRFFGNASVLVQSAKTASNRGGAALEARAGRISVDPGGARIALGGGVRARFAVLAGAGGDAGF